MQMQLRLTMGLFLEKTRNSLSPNNPNTHVDTHVVDSYDACVGWLPGIRPAAVF